MRPKLEQFLAARGLALSEAKTRIVHIDEGFNFLGFTIRRFGRKVLTKPQKEKGEAHIGRLKAIVEEHQSSTQEALIWRLNPLIKGWCNYYRHAVSSRTYQRVENQLWRMLWHWAKRRHPNKSGKWLADRYWKTVAHRKWVFNGIEIILRNPTETKISRWVKVCGRSSPFDPTLRDYWANRSRKTIISQTQSRQKLAILQAQSYQCGYCGVKLQPDDTIDFHHRVPRAEGGTDTTDNLMVLHEHCHHQLHARRGNAVLKA